jgi:hypothetical protein
VSALPSDATIILRAPVHPVLRRGPVGMHMMALHFIEAIKAVARVDDMNAAKQVMSGTLGSGYFTSTHPVDVLAGEGPIGRHNYPPQGARLLTLSIGSGDNPTCP